MSIFGSEILYEPGDYVMLEIDLRIKPMPATVTLASRDLTAIGKDQIKPLLRDEVSYEFADRYRAGLSLADLFDETMIAVQYSYGSTKRSHVFFNGGQYIVSDAVKAAIELVDVHKVSEFFPVEIFRLSTGMPIKLPKGRSYFFWNVMCVLDSAVLIQEEAIRQENNGMFDRGCSYKLDKDVIGDHNIFRVGYIALHPIFVHKSVEAVLRAKSPDGFLFLPPEHNRINTADMFSHRNRAIWNRYKGVPS